MGKLRHGAYPAQWARLGVLLSPPPTPFWRPVLPVWALKWAASPEVWGCRRQAHWPLWVPVSVSADPSGCHLRLMEVMPYSEPGTPCITESPEPGRGQLARGRGWCRVHRAWVSLVNGLLVSGACASWDSGGGGSRSRGSSAPGDALNPLPAAPPLPPPSQPWPQWRGIRQAGAAARGCCGSVLSHAVAAGAARCSLRGARPGQQCWGWVPALPGKGSEPQGADGTPQQSPRGLVAGQRVRLPSQKLPPQCPSPWHPACGLGWGVGSRMSPLPPSFPAS